MADATSWDDSGPLARGLRAVIPALPGARWARVLLGVGAVAAALAVGWLPAVAVAVVVLVVLALPETRPTRLDWAVPSLLRAVEYGAVAWLVAAWAPSHAVAGYALLAAVSFHHYDLVYRIRHADASVSPLVTMLGGGYDVRMLAVSLLALGGDDALSVGCWVLAGWLTVLYVGESVTWWRAWLVAAAQEGRPG